MDPNTEKACAVWHRGERWLSVEKSPSSAPPGHLLPASKWGEGKNGGALCAEWHNFPERSQL